MAGILNTYRRIKFPVKKKYIFFLWAFCLCITLLQAQEIKEEKETEVSLPHHRFSVMMNHAHLNRTVQVPGEKKNFIVPAWSFDYDYWFNQKWAIGLHNDLILQQYTIEKEDDKTLLTRSNPLAVSLVGLFKPAKHWVFTSGMGMEFEKSEHLPLIDFGIEYGFELPKEWELSLGLKYENKLRAYDSWQFGMGVSKLIYPKK